MAGAVVWGSFALLFSTSAAHKLGAMRDFSGTMASYGALPRVLVIPASMLVPPLEVRVAAGLLINSVRETAGFIGAGLLVAYAAAMELNLLRGRRNLDCGCLGLRGRGVISAALVWRNLLMAAAVCIRSNARPWGWLDAGTTVAAVCALALLYAAVNGLLRLQARNRLRRG